MNLQSGLATKLLIVIHRSYKDLRRLIYSLIAWSPFLVRIFEGTLRVGKLARFVLPNPINIEAHVLFYYPGDTSLITFLSLGIFEPEVKKSVIQFTQPGITMIDAGANIGYFTLLAARAVGQHGHVYAFEPVPSTLALLRKNVEVNGYNDRVTIIPKALTDKSSRVRIFFDDESSADSSMFSSGDEKDFVDVEGISLDEFFSKQAWPPIHLIKMDIEGAEKFALDGMRELSHRNPGLKLIVEVNLRVVSLVELVEALRACRFSRFHLLEHDIRTVNILQDLSRIVTQKEFTTENLLCEKAN